MVTRAASLDLANVAVDAAAHAVVGGALRLAYSDGNEQRGMIATGVALLGGLFLSTMGGRQGDLMARMGQAAFNGGAVVTGWVLAEKMILGGPDPQSALPTAAEAAALAHQYANAPRAQHVDLNGAFDVNGNKVTRI